MNGVEVHFFKSIFSLREKSPSLARFTKRSLSVAVTMTTSAPPVTTSSSWAQKAAAAAGGGGGGGGGSNNALSSSSASAAANADGNASPPASFDSRRYVVLDTNALLLSGNGGAGLARYAAISGSGSDSAKEGETAAPILVTTAAALAEVRDAASREALERLRGSGVCELSLREPQDEDVKAGTGV